MTQITIKRLLTNRSSLGETREDNAVTDFSCADGDVVLRINHAAVTTNNITYAAFGDVMNYWQFFPTHIDGWGHMPVWGFADVEHSETPEVAVGERFFGYFPIASHLVVRPHRINKHGFYDDAPHRRELVSVYNQYTRCGSGPADSNTSENLQTEFYQSLLRPLFITSYMLADFLVDNEFFGANQLLISSASSKTAYGTAYCLKQNDAGCRLVALTSPQNTDFVKGLGCYDDVLTYAELTSFNSDSTTTYVDFSGSEDLRRSVHSHFGPLLAYDCFVGSAQNTNILKDLGLPGPKTELFFAPVQMQKRSKELGATELAHRFSSELDSFIAHMANENPPWMRIEEHTGFAAAKNLVIDLHAGRCAPNIGNVIRIDTC